MKTKLMNFRLNTVSLYDINSCLFICNWNNFSFWITRKKAFLTVQKRNLWNEWNWWSKVLIKCFFCHYANSFAHLNSKVLNKVCLMILRSNQREKKNDEKNMKNKSKDYMRHCTFVVWHMHTKCCLFLRVFARHTLESMKRDEQQKINQTMNDRRLTNSNYAKEITSNNILFLHSIFFFQEERDFSCTQLK